MEAGRVRRLADRAAVALIGWVWYDVAGRDAAATAALATIEGDGRTPARLVLVGAGIVSLITGAAGLRRAARSVAGDRLPRRAGPDLRRLFGTAIIASTINVLASLIGR